MTTLDPRPGSLMTPAHIRKTSRYLVMLILLAAHWPKRVCAGCVGRVCDGGDCRGVKTLQ